MRILMAAACPLPWSRGTPIRIHRMAEALAARGHDVHVVTYPLGDLSQAVPYNLHRIARGFRRIDPRPGPSLAKLCYLDPLLFGRIRTLLDSGDFDVIHAHHYEGMIASLCARRSSRRLPIVYDAHTLLESELPHYGTALLRPVMARIGRFLDRRIPPRADHVIAVTDRMQQWFVDAAAIAPGRISVIANGVEHEHFADVSSTAERLVAGPQIVFAGNLAAYQRVDLLLDAFLQVRDAIPDAQLCILTSSHADELRSQLAALGLDDSVSLRDPDYASLPSILASADVLVNPRVNCDGIPQKLLNYMAAGRPIVSFAGSAALLEHERNALIAADGDIRGFADAVLRLIREPALARSLGSAARAKVVAGYAWGSVAERVESVYSRVTGSGT